MSQEKILKKIKPSRKGFLIEYVCGFLVLIMAFLVLPKSNNLTYLLLGFSSISIGSAEAHRYLTRYIFKESKLIMVTGLIKQKKKHIYFHPLGFVPDLHVSQGRIQRLLGYGDIHLKGGEGEAFEIKDVNNPHKILELVEERIAKNRKIE